MRILFFIPALNAGGAERVMVTLANYLARKNHTIRILTLNSDESFYQVDTRVTIVGMNICFQKQGVLRKIETLFVEFKRRQMFISEVESFKPDVILSFLFTTNIISISAKKYCKCPLYISERNAPDSYGKIERLLNQLFYPKSDVIVCQGKNVAEFYSRYGGKCIIIPNPINPAAIGNSTGIKKKRIVSVGRLIPQKNHKILIDAFALVEKEFPDYELEIFGEGELRTQLQDQINSLKLQEKVHLCGNRKNVMTTVADYACFVLSSNYEGFPNVLLEAMASGMPVISTDFSTGIARELIIDGENGYVVPVNDVHALADSLRKMLRSEDDMIKMGNNNRDILDRYCESQVCKMWENLLTL